MSRYSRLVSGVAGSDIQILVNEASRLETIRASLLTDLSQSYAAAPSSLESQTGVQQQHKRDKEMRQERKLDVVQEQLSKLQVFISASKMGLI